MLEIEKILKDRLPSHFPESSPKLGPEVVEAYKKGLIDGNEQTLYVIAVLLEMIRACS